MMISDRPQAVTAPTRNDQTLAFSCVEVEPGSVFDLLRAHPDESRMLWQFGDTTLVGIGAAAVITAHGVDRFEVVRDEARRIYADLSVDGEIAPRLMGGFAYRAEATSDEFWSDFPTAYFVLPSIQYLGVGGRAWMIREVPSTQYPVPINTTSISENAAAIEYVTDYEAWAEMIRKGQATGIDKVVLARTAELSAAQSIDPVGALEKLGEKYPHCYRFLIEPPAGSAFFGATPEILASVKDGVLNTVALAGSARRGETVDKDAEIGAALLADAKERQEHQFVIEAIRNNLNGFVSDFAAASVPHLQRLPNIMHLRTDVSARLKGGCDVLDVVAALHPTPAVGGTPREAAVELINELEPVSRGWYAAPIGWMDADGNGEFAVALRSAVSIGNQARLYAGAGIVADSIPEKEWDETAMKFRPMLDALSLTPSPLSVPERGSKFERRGDD